MKGADKSRKSAGHFVVEVQKVRQGPVRVSRDMPLGWLKKRLGYCEYQAVPQSAHVELKIEPSGSGILVRGEIVAWIQTQCGTCLADTAIRLTPRVNTYLHPISERDKNWSDMELTPEDLEKEWFDGETILLDDLLGDALTLELPMNPKCGESCPGFASDLTGEVRPEIDPRLAPLASVRIEKEKQ